MNSENFNNIQENIVDNEKFNSLQNFQKLDLIDYFYDQLFYDEQLKLLTISAYENKKEISQLAKSIYEDDRFQKLDVIDIDPSKQDVVISFKDVLEQAGNVILSDKNIDDKHRLDEALTPIKSLIDLGVLDTQAQQNRLGTELYNLELRIDLNVENKETANSLRNNITDFITTEIDQREEMNYSRQAMIIDRILNEPNYVEKFPLETIKSIKLDVLSYQDDEFKKIIEQIKEQPEEKNKDNIFVTLLKQSGRGEIAFEQQEKIKKEVKPKPKF